MQTSLIARLLALALLLATSIPNTRAVSIPAAQDTTTSTKNTLTSGLARSTVLSVNARQDALIAFDLTQLPASYNASNISSGRLKLYVSRLIKPGDLTIHLVAQAWSETVFGPAPAITTTPIASIPASKLATKRFVILDITPVVKGWLTTPSTNFGLAIQTAEADPVARVTFASKEGPAIGFPAELEVEATQTSTGNSNQGTFSTIGGGDDNLINAGAQFATIPGGVSNEIGASGSFSFAAGRRAVANHTGSFVWADSTNADFSSTADNQFRIRAANGVSIANDAGGGKVVPVGTIYRDNTIVAWGRIAADGFLDSNFNVASVTRISAGRYEVILNSSLISGFSLMPAVTPEVDPDGSNVVPTGAANARFAVTNQVAAGNRFEIYVYNGSFNLVDNDVSFIVTGR